MSVGGKYKSKLREGARKFEEELERDTLKDVKEEVDVDSAEGFIGKEEAIKVLDEEVDEFKAEIEDDASVEGCSRVLHFSFSFEIIRERMKDIFP